MKQLTIDDIPHGYNYAAVNKDGTAFAFWFKPVLVNDAWVQWKDETFGKFIGKDFDTTNYNHSVVRKNYSYKALNEIEIPIEPNPISLEFDFFKPEERLPEKYVEVLIFYLDPNTKNPVMDIGFFTGEKEGQLTWSYVHGNPMLDFDRNPVKIMAWSQISNKKQKLYEHFLRLTGK
jgi:hypothetical protein